MACSSIQRSSSSSSSATMKYDVFVSFRGQDTRNNFANHLFAALQRKGVVAFRDDTKLKKGDSIAPELHHAIEASQVFLVVFSKNYASSTWCLGELEYILHCSQVSGRRVLPVFYDVDPSEVRHQKGSYGEALAKHEVRFQHESEMVQRWREALTQVANLCGWDMHHKPQYAEIEEIVEEIMNILGHNFSSLPKELVGMNSPIEKVVNQLLLDLVDDVRIVGICGMGGIGKTILATALYEQISRQFDARCFIDDLSKIYRHDGPIGAQKQILHQTLGKEHFQICNLYDTTNLIQSRLRRLRALIVVDNVDKVEQLDKLGVNREWLGAGSRIIIISRDEHILKEYGTDVVYKVPLLNETNSLQLFCQKAFKLDHIISSYEKLTIDILSYANGLPLAIKVLGSFLFGRDIDEWKSALARLKDSPNKDIMDVLRLSFEGLEKLEKEIFLDIACFFNLHEKGYVQNVLNRRGFHADIGLRVLIDKSLLSIRDENQIQMHSLLEELGIKIDQENSSTESRKWSRVWLHEQLHNLMLDNEEKEVEAICFLGYMDFNETKITVMGEALSKMTHLRLLILNDVIFSGNLSCLSNELRYVECGSYPFKYLPTSFQPNQLVELILRDNNIKQLWKDKKYLPNLKSLDLRHSKNLRKMPNFGEMPNLEKLNLKGCIKLVQIDPSIGVLRKLVFLKLKDCKNLVSIPNNILGLSSLKYLNLSGCSKVFNIVDLHSLYQKVLATHLLPSLLSLYCLREVDISFCGLSHLPDAIGCLRQLEILNIRGNNFVTLPSLREHSKLLYLNLEHCKLLETLPQLPLSTDIERDHHTGKYWWKTGLVIFNCLKLGESECCSSMAFSWLTQFIQARQYSSTFSYDDERSSTFLYNDDIKIVIPGSEMPIWFNNRSVGDSIRMNISQIMHDSDDNLIGIACCAVFSVAPVDPTTRCLPQLGLKFCNSNFPWSRSLDVPVILEKYLVEVKSDHMWLLYIPLKLFLATLKLISRTLPHVDDIYMKAYSAKGRGLDLDVKNCGYRWVYKQDLQEFNLTMMHPRNPLARKRKFLAIEDEAKTQSFI